MLFMPRFGRDVQPGISYHVYDRANARRPLFEVPDEYDVFLGMIRDGKTRAGVELHAFCLMPNHWHLVVRAGEPRALARFLARLKQVHTQRWHGVRKSWGEGHLYQGRFHSKSLETDEALLNCVRYVERNAFAAYLSTTAEGWPWGSLWHRVRGNPEGLLDPFPVPLPENWVARVNAE